jgi:hypothetical protein
VSAAMKSERDWLSYLSGGNLRTGKPEIGASLALSDSITTVRRVLFEKRLRPPGFPFSPSDIERM